MTKGARSAEHAEDKIAYCKIHPAIGIARLGNSREGFFVGPETPGHAPEPSGGFKDATGAIKRQAARFRIYAYNAKGHVLRELTDAEAEIEWTVHLANRKAASEGFRSRFETEPAPLRNAKYPGPRSDLVNDPGPRTVSGSNRSGPELRIEGGSVFGVHIPLGELRTDEQGHLLVLGGWGRSESPPGYGIGDYANNDGWLDDTSDGPVEAKVTLRRGGETPPVKGARVLCVPPKFAPAHACITTLYDVLREVAEHAGMIEPSPEISFTRDVYPILRRASEYRWLNAAAARGHGPGAKRDFLDPAWLRRVGASADPATAPERQAIARLMRVPTPIAPAHFAHHDQVRMGFAKTSADRTRFEQANYTYMPQMSGDGGVAQMGDPTTWLTLLPSQHAALQRWAKGEFTPDWKGPPSWPRWDEIPLAEQPAALDRAALEPCVGGPFFPGIEMTYLTALDASLYVEAFRLKADVEPGEATRHMALPWQADFFECNTTWWPAARPDDVIPEAEYLEAVRSSLPHDALPQALAYRVPWARGLRQDDAEPSDAGPTPEHPRADPAQPNGDTDMVAQWHRLGFIVPRAGPGGERVYVETERAPAVDIRESFYRMMNIERFPEFLPAARQAARDFLAETRARNAKGEFDELFSPFPYTPEAFEARLQALYLEAAHDAESYEPTSDPLSRQREDVIERLRQFAPFNQTDGVWLRNVVKGGPIDRVRSCLLNIWMDETGDGNVNQDHSNLYTQLLASVGVYLPPVESREYAMNPDFLDSAFTLPVFELVISQFSDEFFPEILGITLSIEWMVLDLKRTAALLRHFKIDPHFFVLHVGIDNATEGHGAQAKEAIKLFLDGLPSGEREHAWQRIWNGFVAMGSLGTLGDDLRKLLARENTPETRMVALIEAKAPYAQLNHGGKTLGANRLNDWFASPKDLLAEMARAGLFVPGHPERSPFFRLLSFDGPMYKVFTPDEQRVIEDYIRSLAPEPAHHRAARVAARALAILAEHDRAAREPRRLVGAAPARQGERVARTLAEWHAAGSRHALAALCDAENGLVTPKEPAGSPLLAEIASGRWGKALAGKPPADVPYANWHEAIEDWIKQGCPLPEDRSARIEVARTIPVETHPREPGRRKRIGLTSIPMELVDKPHRVIHGPGGVH